MKCFMNLLVGLHFEPYLSRPLLFRLYLPLAFLLMGLAQVLCRLIVCRFLVVGVYFGLIGFGLLFVCGLLVSPR